MAHLIGPASLGRSFRLAATLGALAAALACSDPETATPPKPAPAPPAQTSGTAALAATTTTAAATPAARSASGLPLYTPQAWPELTTDALKAARAKLPPGAPEDADIAWQLTPGKRGGRLVTAIAADVKSFNPILQDSAGDHTAQGFMFSALYGFDMQQQKESPALAKSWGYDPATRTWTFHLRRGLKWSDGQPLTADDFVFFTQVAFDPKIPNDFNFVFRAEPKEGSPKYVFTAVDPVTLKVTIPTDDAFSFEALGQLMALPRHTLEKAWKAGKFGEQWLQNVNPKDLVVSGPYKLKELRQNEVVVLERNPYYFRYDVNGTQLPYLDEIVLRNVPDQMAEHVQFLSGELDLMEEGQGVFPEMLPKFLDAKDKGDFTVFNLGPSFNVNHYFFNTSRGGSYKGADGKPVKWDPATPTETPAPSLKGYKPFVSPTKLHWFENVEFRRACSEATNRQRMIDTVLFGEGLPLYGWQSPANKQWFNPKEIRFPYDPAAARARLDKLGWIDRDGDGIREDDKGNPIRFNVTCNKDNPIRTKMLQLLVEDLRAIGLGATGQVLEFNDLVTRIRQTYDYDAIMLGFASAVPPHPSMETNVLPSGGESHLGYPKQKAPMTDWEAQIDKLYGQLKHTFDVNEQKRIYFQIIDLFNSNQPAIEMFVANAFSAAHNKIGNLKPAVLRVSLMWNVDELYIK